MVRVDGEFTDWFQTVVGVLQGCVLSPLLFCVFLKVVAAGALGMKKEGVVVSGSRISHLKFADDIALTTESQKKLQAMIDRVVTESQQFGMTVSTAKTEVQCIPEEDSHMTLWINGVALRQTKEFVYL